MNRIEIEYNGPDVTEFERTKANEDIATIIDILLNRDYEIRLFRDEYTVIIEFALDPNVYGGPHLEWIDEDE